MSLRERFLSSDFYRVFNFKTETAKGRTLTTINTAVANLANAIITGALYTAFLAENGIDIVRVGIISFIPYISWMLSIFSPTILSQLRTRQKILLYNDYIFYGSLVFGTTIMPLIVKDPTAKTIWFAIFLFIGNASNALVGSGYTAWLVKFVPKGRDLNVYTAWGNMANLICSNSMGIIASLVATALEASGNRFWFIFWLRIAAGVVFIAGSMMIYLIPKEEPVELSPVKIRPRHVITEPIKHKAFMLTTLIPVIWCFSQSINSGTYSYYLLETVKVPMPYLYISSVSTMICSVLCTKFFRRYMDKTSAFHIMMLSIVSFFVMELFYVFVAPGRIGIYVTLVALNGFENVAFNLGYNQLFYLHLPENSNRDLFATFWNLALNLPSFLGAALGAALLAKFEAHGVYSFIGMDFHGSQLLCVLKIFIYAIIFFYIKKVEPILKHGSRAA